MRRAIALILSTALSATFAQAGVPEPEPLVLQTGRVVPAVASTPGVGGSFFKTSLQLFNPFGSPLSGKLVFHPAGVSGSPADPGLDFALAAGQTIGYDDVLAAMGREGLGTLDVAVPNASSSPVIVARVYNDAGAAGTSGFTEEAVSPSETGSGSPVLKANTTGYLVAPSDLTDFRFNIGVRTLASGVSMSIFVQDADGSIVFLTQRSLVPNLFLQQEASAFLGTALPPGGTVKFRVQGGSAIVYGAMADNRTQDPSIQYARVTP